MPAILLSLLLLLFSSNIFSSELAAHVVALTGHVQSIAFDKSTRDLKKGDAIYAKESLVTAKNSSAKLLFTDGSKFELSSETSLEISRYNYNNPDQVDSFSTRIIKGTFRFVTGLIASKTPLSMNVK